MIIKAKFGRLFSLFIGIFLCIWVFNFFNGTEALSIINKNLFDMHYLIIAHIPTLIFDSLSWFVLLGRDKISFQWSLIITWISQACVKFLPVGNISGEFVRIYLLVSQGLKTPVASSIVVTDLILATFSLFAISVFSLFFIVVDSYDLLYKENNLFFLFFLFIFFLVFIFAFLLIRFRLVKLFFRRFKKYKNALISKSIIKNFLKVDFLLYKMSFEKKKILTSLFFKTIGWICGAFEIYIFLLIIGIDANFLDLIILESLMSLIRSFVFFIPAGIGVQELSFILVGNYLGLPHSISLTIAVGRRIREVLVSIPAIFTWILISKKNYV